jgi:hypothetical protein
MALKEHLVSIHECRFQSVTFQLDFRQHEVCVVELWGDSHSRMLHPMAVEKADRDSLLREAP